jgi:hypothetical protein
MQFYAQFFFLFLQTWMQNVQFQVTAERVGQNCSLYERASCWPRDMGYCWTRAQHIINAKFVHDICSKVQLGGSRTHARLLQLPTKFTQKKGDLSTTLTTKITT